MVKMLARSMDFYSSGLPGVPGVSGALLTSSFESQPLPAEIQRALTRVSQCARPLAKRLLPAPRQPKARNGATSMPQT